MKKLTKLLFLPVLWAMSAGCSEDDPGVSSVNFEQTDLTMIEGSTHRLSVVVLPKDAEYGALGWVSSDESVAEVDGYGLITAKNVGQCRISAGVGTVTAYCDLEVVPTPVSTLAVVPSEAGMYPGDQLQLTADIELAEVRSDAGDAVDWSSSDPKIIAVDGQGIVTAMAPGEAVVTARFRGVSGECRIVVDEIPVTEVRIEPAELSLLAGATEVLSAAVLPNNVVDKRVSWSSSDESVATVADGRVTAVGAGSAVITAEAGGVKGECSVSVTVKEAEAGDFYYSDGTWSTALDPEKEVIGVVYWIGDPTFGDATLKREHPTCTRGLVLAISDAGSTVWQDPTDGSVSDWAVDNTDCLGFASGTNLEDPINRIMGYNNTRGIEAYHKANSRYPVQAFDMLSAYARTHPAPEETSGWYIPSVKEVSLMITGKWDDNIFNIGNNKAGTLFLNDRLAAVEGASPISEENLTLYHSSTENTWNNVFMVQGNGMLMMFDKAREGILRPVLAF